MTQIHLAQTGRGVRVFMRGLTANLNPIAGGWEVGQFVQTGTLSRISVEQMIAEAFPDLVIPHLEKQTVDLGPY